MKELYKFQIEKYFTAFYSDVTEVEDRTFRNYEMVPICTDNGKIDFLFNFGIYSSSRISEIFEVSKIPLGFLNAPVITLQVG